MHQQLQTVISLSLLLKWLQQELLESLENFLSYGYSWSQLEYPSKSYAPAKSSLLFCTLEGCVGNIDLLCTFSPFLALNSHFAPLDNSKGNLKIEILSLKLNSRLKKMGLQSQVAKTPKLAAGLVWVLEGNWMGN